MAEEDTRYLARQGDADMLGKQVFIHIHYTCNMQLSGLKNVYIHIHIYIYIHIHVRVCVCVYVCGCVSLSLSRSLSIDNSQD